MKTLIINFNRLSLPLKLANWCANNGLEPIIIDNNSTYPPLLEYYNTRCPFPVVRMKENYGAHVVWKENLLDKLGIRGNYIVTDPDLDLSGIPPDFLIVLEEGLRSYPMFDKCGFSLELQGVKNQGTIDWEKPFWQSALDSMYFNAPVDTTFALYKTRTFSYKGLRTNRPYTAIHVPWSYDHIRDLPEDEQYYYRTQDEDTASHTHVRKDENS
jgi:hypothetical protein